MIRSSMNATLFSIGLAMIVFGIVVAAVGIVSASRLLAWLLRLPELAVELKKGNTAVGVVYAGATLALGILVQHTVSSTFAAMDFLQQGGGVDPALIGSLAVYATLHVVLSLVVGAAALAFGGWLFTVLTRGLDEIAEIRRGNVAPAILLAAVLVVMALMTAPGLETALDGLLPLPELPDGALLRTLS
jgi:uncharacterized membrane protein YjfL (UPF0719 family)